MACEERRGDLSSLITEHREVARRLGKLLNIAVATAELTDEWNECVEQELQIREQLMDWAPTQPSDLDTSFPYFAGIVQLAKRGTETEVRSFVTAMAALCDLLDKSAATD